MRTICRSGAQQSMKWCAPEVSPLPSASAEVGEAAFVASSPFLSLFVAGLFGGGVDAAVEFFAGHSRAAHRKLLLDWQRDGREAKRPQGLVLLLPLVGDL